MGSGNFIGHALPASFFFGFGCFFLLLTLKRCRCLDMKRKKNNDDAMTFSFANVYLPEHNHKLLLRSGILLMICTTLGGLVEVGGGIKDGLGFFHQLAHEALYLSVFFTGAVCVLEGNKLLFENAHRYALTLTFLLQYILWNEHALMKVDPSDARVHMLQAHINFVTFIMFGYSVYSPKSIFAYVASWAVMTLNGMWMFTAGLTTCCVEIMTHTVGAVLVLEVLLLVSVCTLCTACFLDPPVMSYNHTATRTDMEMKYSSVKGEESDLDDIEVTAATAAG